MPNFGAAIQDIYRRAELTFQPFYEAACFPYFLLIQFQNPFGEVSQTVVHNIETFGFCSKLMPHKIHELTLICRRQTPHVNTVQVSESSLPVFWRADKRNPPNWHSPQIHGLEDE